MITCEYILMNGGHRLINGQLIAQSKSNYIPFTGSVGPNAIEVFPWRSVGRLRPQLVEPTPTDPSDDGPHLPLMFPMYY